MKKKAAKKSPSPRKAAPKSKRHIPSGEWTVSPVLPLFDRVTTILENARSTAVRAVNRQMVIANWLIGREITLELQEGDERAEYGRQVIQELASKLTERFGRGFSAINLHYFRQFYQTYPDRLSPILHKPCGESPPDSGENPTIGLILCTEKTETIARYSVLKESQQLFASKYRLHLPTEEELAAELKREVLTIQEGRMG